MRKLRIFIRETHIWGRGGRNRPQESEKHPQRTPQKALFKHASSSTVPSPVGFADTLVGAWPAEPVVKSPEAAFVGAFTGQPQLQKKSDRVVGPSFGNAAAAEKYIMYTKH